MRQPSNFLLSWRASFWLDTFYTPLKYKNGFFFFLAEILVEDRTHWSIKNAHWVWSQQMLSFVFQKWFRSSTALHHISTTHWVQNLRRAAQWTGHGHCTFEMFPKGLQVLLWSKQKWRAYSWLGSYHSLGLSCTYEWILAVCGGKWVILYSTRRSPVWNIKINRLVSP